MVAAETPKETPDRGKERTIMDNDATRLLEAARQDDELGAIVAAVSLFSRAVTALERSATALETLASTVDPFGNQYPRIRTRETNR